MTLQYQNLQNKIILRVAAAGTTENRGYYLSLPETVKHRSIAICRLLMMRTVPAPTITRPGEITHPGKWMILM